MLNAFCLSMTLAIGQSPTEIAVPTPPDLPRNVGIPQITALPGNPPPIHLVNPPSRALITIEPAIPTAPAVPYQLPAFPVQQAVEPKETPKKGNGGDKQEEEEEKKEPEKGHFMKLVEGTQLGCLMEQRRISFSGWTQQSYTASQTDTSNLPVTWNDRANRYLLQQHWMRFERSLDTESKCPSWGWRVDGLFGTDYRYTLPRGLWNSQLLNSNSDLREPTGREQNLYGFDAVQFYANAYFPNLFEGTEIRVGRMFCLFGYESNEAVSTPLLSRSYAFNFSPFTHTGIMINPKFNNQWSAKLMLSLGNDAFIDPADELNFVGQINWTSTDAKDSVALSWVAGRGKMNVGEPFNPATASTMFEPAGRNNINALDLIWVHQLTSRCTYAMEMYYGWQTGVPLGVPGGIVGPVGPSGTAHWGSIVNYFNYKWNDKVSSIVRAELFDDFDGQRTGFEGLYTALTVGAQWKPKDWILVRPEIRYDVNTDTPAFEGGRRSLWTAATDLVIRW